MTTSPDAQEAIEIKIGNTFEQFVFDYCQQQPERSLEERIAVALSAFHAPFAAKAANKSPEQVQAIAEDSIAQLKCQLSLMQALFLDDREEKRSA